MYVICYDFNLPFYHPIHPSELAAPPSPAKRQPHARENHASLARVSLFDTRGGARGDEWDNARKSCFYTKRKEGKHINDAHAKKHAQSYAHSLALCVRAWSTRGVRMEGGSHRRAPPAARARAQKTTGWGLLSLSKG